MTNVRRLFLLFALPALTLLLFVLGHPWLAQAADHQESPLFILADTTVTMAPELAVLAEVWDDTDIVHIKDASYSLLGYTDSVRFYGSTTQPLQMQNWLSALTAEGGGACPDAGLQALQAAARLAGPFDFDTMALLYSNAAPQGRLAALAYTNARLLQNGVRVFPVQSGWCPESPLPPRAIRLLAEMTGGFAYPTSATTQVTNTMMALNQMAATDVVVNWQDVVEPGAGQEYQVPVDSSVAGLNITLGIAGDFDGDGLADVGLTVRDPAGEALVGEGGPLPPGVKMLATGDSLQLTVGPEYMPLTGTWQIEVAGAAAYHLRVSVQSGIGLDYLGRHTLPAGQAANVSVALATPPGLGVEGNNLSAALVAADEPVRIIGVLVAQLLSFSLSGEGGGLWNGLTPELPPGNYHLMVEGQLADGSWFQRTDPALIRVQRFRVQAPGERQATAGTNLVRTFSVGNESSETTTFELALDSGEGWALTSGVPASITLAPGETRQFAVPITVPSGVAPGTVEETTLTAVAGGDLLASQTATARVVVVAELRLYLPVISRPQ